MSDQKSPLKSKTNWVQVPFIAALAGVFSIPGVEKMLCSNGKFVLAAQIILTLMARNLRSNIKLKRDSE